MIRISELAAALLVGGLLFVAPLQAQTTTVWTGTTNNQWAEVGNWDNGLPSGSQNASIQTGSVYLNATAAARTLNLATSSGASATLVIQSGAALSVSSAAASLIGTGSGATGTVTQTGGSATFNNALTLGSNASSTGGTGSYTISGGSLTVNGALRLGNSTTGSSTSQVTQSGGTIAVDSLALGNARYTGGTGTPTHTTGYTISGGTLTVSGNFTHGLTTTGGSGRIYATTQIIGSGATISVGGNLALNDNTRNFSTLSYALDDGGVSRISLTGSGTVALAGTLTAGFKGGLALTATDSFRLIETNTGNITGSFGTGPNAALWSVATSTVSGTRDAVVLSLAGSAQKAALTASVQSAAFAASTTGYATLADLTIGENVGLYLAAAAGTGKTLTDLVTYFTDNGIAATALEGGPYSVLITRQAAAESSWFAWDLSAFNADATLSGIAVAAIPEPSSWSLLLGSGTLLLAAVRRSPRRG